MIRWSQPEILLYDDDPYIRMSYPDLVEDGGQVLRHRDAEGRRAGCTRFPGALLDGLFGQFSRRVVTQTGLVLNLHQPLPAETKMPPLPEFNRRDTKAADLGGKDLRAGFSLDFWLELGFEHCLPASLRLPRSDGQGYPRLRHRPWHDPYQPQRRPPGNELGKRPRGALGRETATRRHHRGRRTEGHQLRRQRCALRRRRRTSLRVGPVQPDPAHTEWSRYGPDWPARSLAARLCSGARAPAKPWETSARDRDQGSEIRITIACSWTR